ncbi:MAG: hypothetical protein HC862_24325 [Scytonema sp. RU_4_4]|nr:hypothetical protein [Scytonema sp. RU_4_4]
MGNLNRLIEYKIDDEHTILVEVVEPMPGGLAPVGRTADTVAKAQKTLSEAVDNVKPVAEAIIGKLSNLSTPPSEIAVEFGLKLSANAGAILTAVGVECNYVVKLTWKEDQNKNPKK